jgi:oxygen-independent coproporphyrinogen-3 oxidase
MGRALHESQYSGTDWQSAFAAARARLHALGIPEVLPELAAAGIMLSRTVLGGSHSVAIYPPIDSLTPVSADFAASADCGDTASLYVHIAFCETRCTFCHYAVDHYSPHGPSRPGAEEGVVRYLASLKLDLRRWARRLCKRGTALTSIYIGGGTPLVLAPELLEDLVRTIWDEFQVVPGADFCVEGSPLTITAPDGRHKLELLKAHGANRLSFGVQSFDDRVLKYAARGYTREVPIAAAGIAASIFDNWNIDLIQGLYAGSPREIWGNLKVIAGIKPSHVTWYHARFGERPQGDWYKDPGKHDRFESDRQILEGRMLLWQQMGRLGYQQCDGNRFVSDLHYVDPFKRIRTSASSNLIGVGAAAYSHLCSPDAASGRRGYVFRNEPHIRTYVDKVLGGDDAVARGRIIDDEELLAMSYATGLRSGRAESDELRSISRRKPALARYYESIAHSLERLGAIERCRSPGGELGLRLSELGRLFEDEVLSLFFSPAVLEGLGAVSAPSARSGTGQSRGGALRNKPVLATALTDPGNSNVANRDYQLTP